MTTKVHSPAAPPVQPNNYISGECWSVAYGVGRGYGRTSITIDDIVAWHGTRPHSVKIMYAEGEVCKACQECEALRLVVNIGQDDINWRNLNLPLEIDCLPMDKWYIENRGRCDAVAIFTFRRQRK